LAGPKRLKPRGIAAEGLRMLLPHQVDETVCIIGPKWENFKLSFGLAYLNCKRSKR